ncbi:MAG: hypothetical protein ACLQU3_12535 [Limisphaerales bacterium]
MANLLPQPGPGRLAQGCSRTPNPSKVESFLKESGFHHQLVLEGFTSYFKETLDRHGLYLAAIQQRGPCLKIHVCFPPSYTPSKKFKLYQMMHALIRESGYKARRLWLTVKERQVSMWIVPQDD